MLRDQKVHELGLRLPILGVRVRLGSFFEREIGHFHQSLFLCTLRLLAWLVRVV
jgi:hypothetical protein